MSNEWEKPLLEDLVMTLKFMTRTHFLKVLRHKKKTLIQKKCGFPVVEA